MKGSINYLRYEDTYNEFCDKFPLAEVEDYRPAVELYVPQLSKGIPNAIIVWLKNGEKLVYVSKEERQSGRCGRMTKEYILEYFKDINYVYNDSSRYDDLEMLLNRLLEEIKAEINAYLQAEGFGSEYRNDVMQIIDKHIGK